jgi:D-alanyl-D-alanine dipeptidase
MGDIPGATDGNTQHVYIREAADALNRRMSTLRKWCQTDVLPEALRPARGIRGWRYWTPEQIEAIKEWMRETDRRSGKSLAHWNPTEKELDEVIETMRRPHSFKKRPITELK